MAGLTYKDIPAGGLVITMGKTGMKMLDATNAASGDEEGEEHISGAATPHVREHRPEVVITQDAVAPAAPTAPRVVVPKVARTMTEADLTAMAQSTSIEHTPKVFAGVDGSVSNLDSQAAAALVDAELGGGHDDGAEISGPVLTVTEDDVNGQGLTQVDERQGHRTKTQASIRKPGRGGTRPVKKA
jgi:hypothetical protein